ncbi:Protein crossbronx -like protein [Escovopsis weberi]|uniref:Protein crossbronx-like protein n=1 Tax=Escovopsis weberi TaxID=150374 RepID=A0A0M9VSJ7_ESCWE|nr:Protein crossbronx -like protein [Escovopsis weberi]
MPRGSLCPYATAVLRFHISFPDSYPRTPPLVTFQTDMFHPLITPLTTHMYALELQIDALGGTAGQEILPPGGFSLRHGFPEWYSRDKNIQQQAAPAGSKGPGGGGGGGAEQSGQTTPTTTTPTKTKTKTTITMTTTTASTELPRYMQTDRRTVSTYSILKYIRSTFDREDVLDSVPLGATGNPGAWHAWRTHRRKQGKVFQDDRAVPTPAQTPAAPTPGGDAPGGDQGHDQQQQQQQQLEPQPQAEKQAQGQEQQPQQQQAEESKADETVRRPEDWNWEGVWEDRVKKGIASTLTESVLYGAAGGPESLIHFLALEDGDIQTVKENLRRTLGIPV